MAFPQIGDYPIDIFVKEVHGFENEITQYAVETGSDVTDNVRTQPDTLTIDGVVSDTPTGAIAGDPTRTGVGELSISKDAYNRLTKMRNDKLPLSVVTSLGTYTSMEIKKLEITRDAKSFKGLIFTCEFERVVIVENKRVTVSVPNLAGKGSLGNKDSDLFRRTALIPGQTIPVVTLRDKQSIPAWTKIYGKPIDTAAEVVLLDGITPSTVRPDQSGYHFDITNTATNAPDGYLKAGGFQGTLGTSDIVYEALNPRKVKSTQQTVSDLVHDANTRKQALDFAQSHGQHFDPKSGTWKDVNGNTVTHDPNAYQNFQNRLRDTKPTSLEDTK